MAQHIGLRPFVVDGADLGFRGVAAESDRLASRTKKDRDRARIFIRRFSLQFRFPAAQTRPEVGLLIASRWQPIASWREARGRAAALESLPGTILSVL